MDGNLPFSIVMSRLVRASQVQPQRLTHRVLIAERPTPIISLMLKNVSFGKMTPFVVIFLALVATSVRCDDTVPTKTPIDCLYEMTTSGMK